MEGCFVTSSYHSFQVYYDANSTADFPSYFHKSSAYSFIGNFTPYIWSIENNLAIFSQTAYIKKLIILF